HVTSQQMLLSTLAWVRSSSGRSAGQGRAFFGRFFDLLSPPNARLRLVALLLALLGEPHRLAHALTQVEQLGPSRFAAAADRHAGDEWRIHRINSLNAFVIHDAAKGEDLIDPPPLAGSS